MPRWRVRLEGEDFDLQQLAKDFAMGARRVVEHAPGYHLEADELDTLDTAEQVRRRAVDVLQDLNAATRLQWGRSFRTAGVGRTVSRVDGDGGALSVFIESGMEVRGGVTDVVVRIDGVEQPRPVAPSVKWAAAGAADPVVHRVNLFLSKPILGWDELYKIHEVLLENDGQKALAMAGISGKRLTLFTYTANNFHALGDAARHASTVDPAPAKPMTLEEAENLILTWVREWLDLRATP